MAPENDYVPRDLTEIDARREEDLDYWSRTLETDREKIRRAVGKVGPGLEKVKKELGIAGV